MKFVFYAEIEFNGNNLATRPVDKSEHNSVSFDVEPAPQQWNNLDRKMDFLYGRYPSGSLPQHSFYFAGSANIYNPLWFLLSLNLTAGWELFRQTKLYDGLEM